MIRRAAVALAIAAGLLSACESSSVRRASAEASACREVTFEDSRFTDCTAEPGKHTVRLVLDGADGKPLRSLSSLAESPDGAKAAFAMNAGMFDESGGPIGLFVSEGLERRGLNRKAGPGNFHMLPNGVFFGDGQGWHVLTSDAYAARQVPSPTFAIQSGPMLVIAGKLHPKFSGDGESRYIRNGVGIDADGKAHFVISDEPVSFGKLARLFRDRLRCANALYFDGFVSALWDPAAGRMDGSPPLGPLVVVEPVSGAASAR